MNRLLRKAAARTAGTVLTVAVLGLAAVFVLSALGIARFVPVLSNSMAPDMPKGFLAVVLPTPREDITAGDTIVFTAPDGSHKRVIHRIKHLYGPEEEARIRNWTEDRIFLETKGDNNPAADPWILTLADPKIWRQTTVVPYAGWPVIWLAEPTVRVIAFGLAGAAVAAWALITIWRRPDPDENEENEPDSGPIDHRESGTVSRR